MVSSTKCEKQLCLWEMSPGVAHLEVCSQSRLYGNPSMTYMYITNFPLDNNKESGTDPCSYSHVVETVGGLEEIKLVDEQSKVDEHVHSLQVRAQQTSVK